MASGTIIKLTKGELLYAPCLKDLEVKKRHEPVKLEEQAI